MGDEAEAAQRAALLAEGKLRLLKFRKKRKGDKQSKIDHVSLSQGDRNDQRQRDSDTMDVRDSQHSPASDHDPANVSETRIRDALPFGESPNAQTPSHQHLFPGPNPTTDLGPATTETAKPMLYSSGHCLPEISATRLEDDQRKTGYAQVEQPLTQQTQVQPTMLLDQRAPLQSAHFAEVADGDSGLTQSRHWHVSWLDQQPSSPESAQQGTAELKLRKEIQALKRLLLQVSQEKMALERDSEQGGRVELHDSAQTLLDLQKRFTKELQRRQELEEQTDRWAMEYNTQLQQWQQQMDQLRTERDGEHQQARALSDELVRVQRDFKLALSRQQQHVLGTDALVHKVRQLEHLLQVREHDLEVAQSLRQEQVQDGQPRSAQLVAQQQISTLTGKLDEKETENSLLHRQLQEQELARKDLEQKLNDAEQGRSRVEVAAPKAGADHLQDQEIFQVRKVRPCCAITVAERDTARGEANKAMDALQALQEQHESLLNSSTARSALLRKHTVELTTLRLKMAESKATEKDNDEQDNLSQQLADIRREQRALQQLCQEQETQIMNLLGQQSSDAERIATLLRESSATTELEQEITRSRSFREKLRDAEDKLGFLFLKFQFVSERCKVLEMTCQNLLSTGSQAHQDAVMDVAANVRSNLPEDFEQFWQQCKGHSWVLSPAKMRVPLDGALPSGQDSMEADALNEHSSPKSSPLAVSHHGHSVSSGRPPWRS